MNPRLVPAIFGLAFCGLPVFATGTLDFKANNYYLSMTVSLESNSVVGPIRFAPPNSKSPFIIQQSQFKIFLCNTKTQQFTAEFVNPGDPTVPQSFKISVRGTRGQLYISGKRVSFAADWSVM